MNTRQISCFLESATCNSFSQAAKRLYISQPSFSRYISQLETELGLTLFDRSSFNGVALTESGRIMYDALRNARNEVERATEKARCLERRQALRLTLGLLEGQLMDVTLEDILSRFRLEHTHVTVDIRRDTYRQLTDALKGADIDLVCMPEWEYEGDDELEIAPHVEIETVLAVPKRLAPERQERTYSIAEFSELPFVSVAERERRPVATMLNRLFAAAHIDPPILYAKNLREQIQMVEMGEGAILINPYNYICFSPNISCFHVAELAPQPFSFAWRRTGTSVALNLLRPFLVAHGRR